MLLKKSLVLAGYNWKSMVKALLMQLLILAIAVALGFLIFDTLINDVMAALDSFDWNGMLTEIFASISEGTFDGDAFAEMVRDFLSQAKAAVESIPNLWNRFELSYLYVFLGLALYRIFISLTDVPVAFQLQEFMTSNAKRPFTWYAVKKFGETIRFVCLQMLLTLPLDLLLAFAAIGMAVAFALPFGLWGLLPVALVCVALYAARQAYFAFWLPALATDQPKVVDAMKKGVATIPTRFWRVFGKTFVLIVLMVTVSVVSVMFVSNDILKLILGSVLDLILFFIMKCFNFVEYFEAIGQPYFYKKIDVEGTKRRGKIRQK